MIRQFQPAPTCSACHAPHADQASICQGCSAKLRGVLNQARLALVELDVTLSRQARIGRDEAGRRPSSNRPLPYDPAAAEATDVLLAHTIMRWALDVWRATESPLTSKPPADPIGYLLERIDQIRLRGYAAALLDEVEAAVGNAWSVVDLAAEHLEAGKCECGTRLAARPDMPEVTCRACGRTYDVRDRREAMVTYAEDLRMPAKQIERLVDVFLRIGANERVRKRIPSGSVRGWASKGEITIRGFVDGKTPVYRVGDVFDRAFREIGMVTAA